MILSFMRILTADQWLYHQLARELLVNNVACLRHGCPLINHTMMLKTLHLSDSYRCIKPTSPSSSGSGPKDQQLGIYTVTNLDQYVRFNSNITPHDFNTTG
jgi:hypothetical protein